VEHCHALGVRKIEQRNGTSEITNNNQKITILSPIINPRGREMERRDVNPTETSKKVDKKNHERSDEKEADGEAKIDEEKRMKQWKKEPKNQLLFG